MKDLTTMAISKAIGGTTKAAKEARKAMTVGEHPISAMVHLDGIISVEEDQQITPTASLMNEDFLALVLHHAGITRESALKAIEAVAGTYLVDWKGTKEDKKAAKAARKSQVAKFDPEGKMAEKFANFKANLPKIPRVGKVTFKGSVQEVALPVLRAVKEVEEQIA